LVFIGSVREVGPAPDVASGTFAVFRPVTYAVEAVLFGPVGPPVRTVRHHVVSEVRDRQPARTADPATPYRRGARVLVTAQWVDDPAQPGARVLEEMDSDTGAVELTAGALAALGLATGPAAAAPRSPARLPPDLLLLGALGLAATGVAAALAGGSGLALALGLAAVVAGLLHLAGGR
jgi:hypothetical protein